MSTKTTITAEQGTRMQQHAQRMVANLRDERARALTLGYSADGPEIAAVDANLARWERMASRNNTGRTIVGAL